MTVNRNRNLCIFCEAALQSLTWIQHQPVRVDDVDLLFGPVRVNFLIPLKSAELRTCFFQRSWARKLRPCWKFAIPDGGARISQDIHACRTSSTAFFVPTLLHSLAVWVTLAFQNMPAKARAPEARMVCVGGTKFLGLNFAHIPGQADVSPQYYHER